MQFRENFPKENRLLTSKQFQFVFKNQRKFSSEFFLILSAPNGLIHSRIGIVIRRRNIKNAVARNSLKRVIRESFRKNSVIVSSGLDMVIIIHKFLSKKQLSIYLENQWRKIQGFYRKS